jgi:hypothetical protein
MSSHDGMARGASRDLVAAKLNVRVGGIAFTTHIDLRHRFASLATGYLPIKAASNAIPTPRYSEAARNDSPEAANPR